MVKKLYSTYNPSELDEQETQKGIGFLIPPLYLLIILWFVFWADHRFALQLYQYGVMPRSLDGLIGVITAPVLHGSASHLASNSLPILVLGAGLYYFYPKIATRIILISWITSGLLVWLIGRNSFHIGASGLVYALAGFIFLSGVLRKQPNLLALSLLVVFLYGGLMWGILPIENSVSWEAHLAGGIVGFTLAWYYRKMRPAQKKYSWDKEDELEDDLSDDDPYWMPDYDPNHSFKKFSESEINTERKYKIHYHYKSKMEENASEPQKRDSE